eukprot:gnl/MRDRNA2_/MRDRNA2_79911_c0_seq1.p1 gnl/MRDRNA2_/MRDRNA2_79911_c0~~gnl/MRDRNA2_/MRDRNA2_79911_c0_seq1.p1  ORF type:complete len:851 (+),score=130.75 gnl/MRDRNA2_/MRDRNA2_79911_c0_seq1:184-2736(+)
MSDDPMLLSILASKAGAELTYFELVQLKVSGRIRRCYLCVGKDALYLVHKDLKGLLDGGELHYRVIERLVEDTRSSSDFLMLMSKARPHAWESEKLYVMSEHRWRVLTQISCAWQADCMWRTASVHGLPRFHAELRPQAFEDTGVMPFKGCKEVSYRGYTMFLSEAFDHSRDGNWTAQDGSGFSATLHVHEPVPVKALEQVARETVQSLAFEYKKHLTKDLGHFYCLINAPYAKAMNLTDDVAAWEGWEMLLKSSVDTLSCVFLRRSHFPPLLDSVQDFAVMLKCPMQMLNKEGGPTDDDLMEQCHIAADSLYSQSSGDTVYVDMVQAKLDALDYDEDTYHWIPTHLKLRPKPELQARAFLKSIIALMEDDGVILEPDISPSALPLQELCSLHANYPVPRLYNPMQVPQGMLSNAEGIPGGFSESDPRRNHWYARVARYLAYCVDGGLLGNRFTLSDLTRIILGGTLSSENDKKLRAVVDFLFHFRETNWDHFFLAKPLKYVIRDTDSWEDYEYNPRVLQTLFESGYLAAEFGARGTTGNKEASNQFIGKLLMSKQTTDAIKALLCRRIMVLVTTEVEPEQILHTCNCWVPALLHTIRGDNVALSTYATAALVNLSSGKEVAKDAIIGAGCASDCIHQLKLKDEDLMLYTLTLLVNITKSVPHRAVVKSAGAVPVLVDILSSSYHMASRKPRLMSELCKVLGQMCNDSDTQHLLSIEYPVVDCGLYIFDTAADFSALKQNVLFMLRQMCVNDVGNKEKCGAHLMSSLVKDIGNATSKQDEYIFQVLTTLILLAALTSNCELMFNCDMGMKQRNLYDNGFSAKTMQQLQKLYELDTVAVTAADHKEKQKAS